MTALAEAHNLLSLLFCCLATMSNGLLITLIVSNRRSYIGRYGILLTLFASHDILLSLLFAVVQPISHFIDLGYILFAPMAMSVEIQDLLYYTTLFFYFNTLFLLSCHFVFRYVIVLGSTNPLYHLPVATWICIAAVGQICYQAPVLYGMRGIRTPLEDRAWIRELLNNEYEMAIPTEYCSFSFIYALRTSSGLDWQWDVIQKFLLVMIPPTLSIFVMSFCGLSILHRCRSIAPSSTHIHRHLLKALVVQSAIPVLFIFIPLGLQFVMPLVGSRFGRAGMVTATFTSFFPVIDPLLVITLVPLYRRTLSKWLNPVFISRMTSPSRIHSTAVSQSIQSQFN